MRTNTTKHGNIGQRRSLVVVNIEPGFGGDNNVARVGGSPLV